MSTRNNATNRQPATNRQSATNRMAVRNFPYALKFNGLTDFVNCGTDSLLRLSQGGSISAWIKLSSYGSSWTNTIVGRGTSAWAGHYYIIFMPTGTHHFFLSVSNGTNSLGTDDGIKTANVDLHKWYLVTATWDTTTKKIYLNNVLQDTVASNIMPAEIDTHIMAIGKMGNHSYNFNGDISNVRIYDKALSQDEITKMYFNNIIPTGAVAEYFNSDDDGSGDQLKDTSGNDNHGAITGADWSEDTGFKSRANI